ncbi:tRNA (adenosine(37)-N6)-threonylcarbamoyltransferase complex dimerization subunit type 1 TsaB [Phaeobacter sp. QD34_3]|uniref:tRNA (adenosine(37)-N6)-threonylcarbamoyltransferase complex dimerization subunit type 1 TsaB n=1 Tax=unclassified Phaeobacter TaxID=2621772 RepID=UPI00237F482F|nr:MULTISPECIES: tRNA (adenosine(37)-N6)-threonylcarbamoyltransferase complex dimerization subunit type 1 TsaB [unclassified Phaeobacter]MDE4132858.1 tRNA (adenosine(37)-N6)-threonylcarbamoyltransferase complex dimerization subunit type 1 TsaB [Phaeobacter sp. QD34_3]MDE4136349.1 tRNA (adenosine(37)-N6)-threonylcarbamoyltransferase complex dimerization subunit type 1 TsaB [Phaeobacter sp. QD34_24]MDE4174726.1 tRNA (adenosine(37)-N6)-threonylcarbamoyltransferase complex dimerization subunit type 
MTAEPLVLGFDTSAAHCAAALLRGDTLVAEALEPMTRGQAERLMPLLEEVLAVGGATWDDLDAIGVGVGPGNFTGIRIAVSAARGLALGLEIPVVGVDGFEARAETGSLAAIPAPRDQVYAALPGEAPRLMPRQEAEDAARGAGLTFAPEASPAGLAAMIARIATQRKDDVTAPPAPLYLRAADAAPSRDVPPALIDG